MFMPWWTQVRQSANAKRSRNRKVRRRTSFHPVLEMLEDRQVPAVLSVTTTADSGAGSLRQAILDANDTTTNPGQNTIHFNIATSGAQTIALSSPLPALTNSSGVIVDATTEPGFTSTPLVVIDGSGAGGGSGLHITGGNSTVKGLAIENFASGAGVFLQSSGNTVQENFLGSDSTGSTAAANAFGVEIVGANNTIGGATTTARNLISGNSTYGVVVVGSGSTGNVLEGNFIGTNAAGTTALANDFDGVALITAASNTIGGTASGAGNVISGNARFGVFIYGSGTTGNVLQGNAIGVNAAGSAALANAADGVALFGGAATNTIGGTASGAGNVLSGNGRFGLLLSDSGTSGNLVEGNFIGVNRAGTSALANSADGVEILRGAATNTIGGTTSGAGNTIAGNSRFGVLLGVSGTTGNVVAGNFIGTNASSATGLANAASGVALVTGAANNTIGGIVTAAANLISGNGAYGIVLTDSGTTGNLIEGNTIGTNQASTGSLANALDGIAVQGASGNTIGGTAAGAGNVIAGNARFGILLSAGATLVEGNNIGTSATGTTGIGNTEDGIIIYNDGNTIGGTVSGAANTISGNGRFGIFLLGSSATGNQITGNFIGTNQAGTAALANTDDGIALMNGPTGNTIGGTAGGAGNVLSGNGRFGVFLSGPGTSNNVIQGNRIGVNAGASAALANTSDGVAILSGATNNTVGGTASGAGNIIAGNGEIGVLIGGSATSGNQVQGNFVGTNTSGTLSLPNGVEGVALANGASSNSIGGTAGGAGNTIAFNGYAGVIVGATPTDTAVGNSVSGNAIYANGGTGGIGVDVGNDGTTSNNAAGHTGPNHYQNYPVPTTASLSGGAVSITFTLTSVPSSTFLLEFFLNSSSDPTAQGRFFLGSTTATTDATGALTSVPGGTFDGSTHTGTITLTPPAGVTPTAGQLLTAAAIQQTTTGTTATTGDTSEFSPAISLTGLALAPSTLPAADLNTAYNQTLTLPGGTAPVTFTVLSGTLPPGLTLGSSGVLSGTPTTTTGSPFSFTVMATDSASPSHNTGTQSYAIVVHPMVVVTTTSLPNWTANRSGYSQTIAATGGSGSYTFSPTGSLPPGLTLTTGGDLSGTPTTPGTYAFAVTATDTLGGSGSAAYSVTINPGLTFTTTTLASSTVNHPGYGQTISTTGGTGSATFAAPAASLPPGLTLSSTGVLSGTPTAAGSFTFTVTATDTVGATASQSFTVTINPAVTISPTTLPGGTLGVAYNQTLTASGGTGAKTFATTAGALPTGLTLSSAGVLSGTPTTPGTFSFTVTATDAVGATGSQPYTVTINPITVSPSTLADWTVNVPGYNQTITAVGGAPPYTFSTTTGTLPTGLTLSSVGVLSGTPTVTGTFSFTITATDTASTTGSQAYTVVINPTLTISPTILPGGHAQPGKILYFVDGNHGTDEMAAALAALSPPDTVVLATSPTDFATKIATPGFDVGIFSAQIDYGPDYSAALAVLVTFVEGGGKAIVDSWALFAGSDLTPFGATPTGDADGPAARVIGYNSGLANPITLTNPVPPYTNFSFGETLDPTTGTAIAGVFSDPGNASGTDGEAAVVIGNSGRSIVNGFLNDTAGAKGEQLYENEINALLGDTGADTINVPYHETLTTSGGTGAKTFAITGGTLPTGLSLSSAGILSGTPTAAGSFTFIVTATDAVGATITQLYQMIVNPALTVEPASLPPGMDNVPYSQTLTASGGTGTKTFATTTGTLPAGLTLSTTGVLSGTPTATGSFSFTVTATDSAGATGSQGYTLVIS